MVKCAGGCGTDIGFLTRLLLRYCDRCEALIDQQQAYAASQAVNMASASPYYSNAHSATNAYSDFSPNMNTSGGARYINTPSAYNAPVGPSTWQTAPPSGYHPVIGHQHAMNSAVMGMPRYQPNPAPYNLNPAASPQTTRGYHYGLPGQNRPYYSSVQSAPYRPPVRPSPTVTDTTESRPGLRQSGESWGDYKERQARQADERGGNAYSLDFITEA